MLIGNRPRNSGFRSENPIIGRFKQVWSSLFDESMRVTRGRTENLLRRRSARL